VDSLAQHKYLNSLEIESRMQGLSAADCVRLERIAGVFAYSAGWSGSDLMQEAFVAALQRRRWRADLDTTVFLTGVMRSLAHSRQKQQRRSALDQAMAGDAASSDELERLSGDADQDPGKLLEAEQEHSSFLQELMQVFEGDQEVLRVIAGRASGASAAEIKNALGMNQTQYESVCRRLLRGYQQKLKVQRT
jgi:DNA-directed RNA polymerase specialized sigma24 family protein